MAQIKKQLMDVFKFSTSDYKKIIIGVTSSLIVILIVAFFSYISESFFTFIFATTYEIPVWVISLFLISFFLLLSYFLYQISSHKDNSDVEVVDDPKEEITFKDYKTDVIDSVKWEWYWITTDIHSLKPLCPKCFYELNLINVATYKLESLNFEASNGTPKK